MNPITLHILVRDGDRTVATVELSVEPQTPLREVLSRVFREQSLTGFQWGWELSCARVQVDLDWTAGYLAERYGETPVELVLVRRVTVPPSPAAAAPPGRAEYRASKLAPRDAEADGAFVEEDDEDDEDYDDEPVISASVRGPLAGVAMRSRVSMPSEPVTRRATIRYYTRMNPARTFPLLVILSAEQIAEVRKRAVKQAESNGFHVKVGSAVEVEPILPGCDCYPPRDSIPIGNEAVSATFWVVPHVLGRVQGARVVVRQNGVVLAEVPLDVKVAKQTLAVVCGLLSLVAPYASMGLKQLRLDPATQKEEGFALYREVGNWVLDHLSPEVLGVGLIGLAAAFYVAMRPKRKDVFWDVTPKSADTVN